MLSCRTGEALWLFPAWKHIRSASEVLGVHLSQLMPWHGTQRAAAHPRQLN